MYSFSCCSCLPCDVACCNCCIVIQSGMFVVVCMASILNCMPGVSVSLFSMCLESQSVMNRSGLGLYMIWLYIGVFWAEFIVFSVIMFQHLSWRLLLVVYDLLLYSPLSQSTSDGICQAHIVYLVPLFQCCCTFFLHLTDFLLANMMGLSMLSII